MIVGILSVVLSVPGSNSLKDKRQVVRSFLDGIRHRFNVSAAEIGALDSHTRAELAFACVSNEQALVSRTLSKILAQAESNPLCEVLDSALEFV